MISSQRHSHHTTSNQEPSSSTTATNTEPAESERSSTTATGTHPTAVGTSEDSTAAGEPSGTIDSQGAQQHQSETSRSAAEGDADHGGSSGCAPPKSASGQVSPATFAGPEAAPVAVTAAGDTAAPAAQALPADQSSAADTRHSTDEQQPGAGHDSMQASCSAEAGSGDCKSDDWQIGNANGAGGSQAETPNGHSAPASSPAVPMNGEVNSVTETCTTGQQRDEPADDNCGVAGGAALGSGSSQSSGSGEKQHQQAKQSNGSARVDGMAPRTPIRKAPKKGGLVNVQRPAVKGYSIHRSLSPPAPRLLLSPNNHHLQGAAAEYIPMSCV